MKYLFFLVAVSITLLQISAGENEPDAINAKQIYLNAKKADRKEISQINPSHTMVSTYKFSPDGAEFKRFEVRNQNNIRSVTILNESGKYELYPKSKTAIKEPVSTYLNFDDAATYSMKSVSFHEIPCYEIKQEIEQTNQTFDRYQLYVRRLGIKKTNAELKDDFYHTYPNVNMYYIGQSDNLIHGIRSYTSNGSLTGEIQYVEVERLPQIDDSLFQIPDDYKVKVTKNAEDYINTSFEAQKEQAKKKSKTPQSSSPAFFSQVGAFFLSHGGTIFFWLAVALIIIVARLKLRKR